jgi:hypothetical protein
VEQYGNLVLGLFIAAALVVIWVSTAIDMIYMVVPAFQTFIDSRVDDEKNRLFITFDAIRAAEDAAMKGGNLYLAYLRLRMKTLLIGAVLLSLVITGAWEILRAFTLRLIELGITALMGG